jgi:hypothetical protein
LGRRYYFTIPGDYGAAGNGNADQFTGSSDGRIIGIIDPVYPGGYQYPHGFKRGTRPEGAGLDGFFEIVIHIMVTPGTEAGDLFIRKSSVYVDGVIAKAYVFVTIGDPVPVKVHGIFGIQRFIQVPAWGIQGCEPG